MKSLTKAEAAVVRSLLAGQPISERERITRSGVAPRTFEGARRRAYAAGWVFDRYVPDPTLIGQPLVSFVLAQPFAEKFREVEDRWRNDRSCVLVWRWEETLLGVFMADASATAARRSALPEASFRRTFEVAADVREPHVPVYFDFEGAWSRLTGSPGILGYPHSLPLRGWANPPRLFSESERRHVEALVRRPIDRGSISEPLRVSPFFLPRSQQRLLAGGAVERRVFLDPAKAPPFQGRAVERLAFVQGELLPEGSPMGLFRRLAALRILPFLLATDGSKLLLGTLSSAPSTHEREGARPAILANLQHFLKEIEIVRERVSSLTVLVNHRYDRLFA